MDMQGTPIGGGGDGQKVTTDPRSNNLKQESTGYVDPESLAAQSSTFQANNPGSDPPGTTDARNLTSATGGIGHISSAGQAMPESSDQVLDAGPGSAGNFGTYGGTFSGGNVSSGSTGGGNSGSSDSGAGKGNITSPHGDTAPGYITSVVSDLSGGPKGRNLKEDLEGTAPSGLPEPGSKDDPGRLAVHDLEARNATTAGSGPREGELSGGAPYSNLDSERQA